MSSPSLLPSLQSDLGVSTSRYRVVIYNNETTTMDAVVAILMVATGCTREEASIEMWEAHTFGRADVHFASEDECRKVAEVIARIGVHTEVRKEWDD